MLKEQGIREYLNKKDIAFNENSSIIGVIFPSKFTYALGPIATALSMQYYAINFSDSGIAIIGLNNVTGKLEDEAFLFVPKEEVTSVKFNKKLMSYELEISTSKGTLAFKVNKTMVGASWLQWFSIMVEALYICRNVITVYPDCKSMIDVAKQKLMNDPTFKHLSEDCQEYYFDFEAYASHLQEHGKFLVTEHGIFELPEQEMRWCL